MSMTEDLGAFFSTSEFAETATLTPGRAGVVIYDENGTILESMGVQTSGPSALFPVSQWPLASEGDAITIDLAAGSQSFVVRSVEPLDDGAIGLLTLART
ncbi:MAG: hypothetical protein ABI605_10910 [Rhizobacter sp.]